jgi:hypothetical protein
MATDQEVYRYYEILAHLQYKNYTDNLPIVSYFNGVGQTQPQISFQSFMIWDTNGKDLTRRQVKNELPELEKKYKEIKDNYYSSDQIEKRKKVEEERKKKEKDDELKEFEIMYQTQKKQNIHLFWYNDKKERYRIYKNRRELEEDLERMRQQEKEILKTLTKEELEYYKKRIRQKMINKALKKFH